MTFLGLMKAPYDISEVALAWLLMAWFAVAMGLLVGAGAALSETVDRIWHVTAYLFMPLSGAFFMVDWLPYRMQKIALYVPTIDGNELFREGFFGPTVHAHYDLGYMAIVNLVLTTLGFWAVKQVSTRVEGA
jgi:capsular polysaccharide transport system permease protein